MFLKPLSPPARLLVCFGLTAPSLLILVACLLTFKDQRRMHTAFDWVRHTLQVENLIHQLLLAVHELDAAQRSYIYTGRSVYLEAYNSAEIKIPGTLAALCHDTSEDPTQQERFVEMEASVSDRLDLAHQGIDHQKTGHHDAAVKLARSDRGKKDMETIDHIAEEMRSQEELLLASRDRALAALRQTHARWLYALLVLNVSSLACTWLLLRRLDKAQSLARVCAWSKRVEHEGQWLSFEEYLSRRFSIESTHTISPAEVDGLLSELAQEQPSNVR